MRTERVLPSNNADASMGGEILEAALAGKGLAATTRAICIHAAASGSTSRMKRNR
jgi:hypothetical protein